MAQNNNNAKPKLQGSMEYIIILAIVIIVALTAGVYYLSSVHNAKVGALNNIVSAQASSSNTLVLKLSTTLPAGAQVKSINLTGVPSGTSISVSLESQTPVYSNGYPEYSFSVSGLPEPLPYYNVTSLTYEVNGKTITVPTITGEPMAIEETSSYSNSNSNSNSFPKPSSIPSGIVAYVYITLSNSYNFATPAPFQQMITFNPSLYSKYENSNLGNIRFYQGSTELYSWCESGCSNTSSNAIFWVKLPNGISTNGKVIINMTFKSLSTNYDGVYAGEAPQLSCPNPANTIGCSTYGKYDNGANVFNNYWNFAGTSLPSGWTQSNSGTATWRVDNGLTVSEVGPDGFAYQYVYYSIPQTLSPTTGILVDLYGNYSAIPGKAGFGFPSFYGINLGLNFWVGYDESTNKFTDTVFNGGSSNSVDTHIPFSTAKQVWAFYSIGNGMTLVNNYTSTTVNNNEGSSGLYDYMGVSQYGGGTSATVFIQWWRIRALPPNGIMPSVSFGSIQHA